MFFKKIKTPVEAQIKQRDDEAYINAMSKFCAVISFSPDGIVLDANVLFLNTVGYSLEEVQGQKHGIFCSQETVSSLEYSSFWPDLAAGKCQKGVFLRKNKDGSDIWLEATYFPVEVDGKVVKVIKTANDVTLEKSGADNKAAIYTAIDRSSAVIEFEPDGRIINANQNFLATLGYRTVSELIGQHHRKFCTEGFYQENPNFWAELAKGEFKSGQFERINKQGAQSG